MTSTGAVPDLTAAADVLGRAADRLDKLTAAATPGPWCFYGDDLSGTAIGSATLRELAAEYRAGTR